MKKIIKYILIAVPALFLTKCAVELTMSSVDLSPSINSNPTHKMKIHGKFPFEDEVKLDMGLLFITTNPICDKKNPLAGIQFPHIYMKSFPATVKDGVFESDIYLDSYLPGMCEWQAYNVYAIMLSIKDDMSVDGEGLNSNQYDPSGYIPVGANRKDGKKILPTEVDRLPAQIRIGTIEHKTFGEQGKILDVECLKVKEVRWKDLPNETSWEMLDCNYFNKQDEINIRGAYELVPNISSSQKKVEINFIDKGWRK